MTAPLASIKSEWLELRSRRGRLVCRIDRRRGLMQWRQGDDELLVDLIELLSKMDSAEERGSA